MPQFINTNISSLTTQRQLNRSQTALSTAIERISSGMRINSAKDDAAGLAIADRFTAQIRGLNQAARNANDGISLAQTAEGALDSITTNLQRLRELAVQSANATNTSTDRAALQAEAAQLIAEIDRTSTQTQFNGNVLLDGNFKAQAFQVGANANQTISVSMTSARSTALGTGDASAVTAKNNGVAMSSGDVVINGVTIGASLAPSDTASTASASASAIAKAAAFNAVSSQTGVTAKADATFVTGSSMTGTALTGTITINGVTTASVSTTTDTAVSRAAVVQAINNISGQTGVVATDTGLDTGGVTLKAADGRNVVASFTTLTAAATGVGAAATYYGNVTLSATKEITVAASTGTIANAGLVAGTYAPQKAYMSTTTNNGTALASGDVKINGVLIGASLSSYDASSSASATTSAIAKVAAINAISSQTGVTATVNDNVVSGAAMTATTLTGTITINGVTTASITTQSGSAANSRTLVVNAINAISGQTGVTAEDTNTTAGGVKLHAADGRNIVHSFTTLTAAATGVAAATTSRGTYTLTSAKSFTIEAGTTATGTANFGIGFGTYGGTKNGQALSAVDLSTADGANKAITAIDNAINSVDSNRSNLGAIQNRLTSTVDSLQTTAENLTASKSRIVDADFAAETSALTRGQILQQAGLAMLAQANALPQNVLSLLR